MEKLINKFNDNKDSLQRCNMFLIGNGHLGYSGTLEEYTKGHHVTFNLVGMYDKYQNKWRESINMPNPLYIDLKVNDVSLEDMELETTLSLDLYQGILKRKSINSKLIIKSERFINEKDVLVCKYQVKALEDINIHINVGLDTNIYEINGPHFKEKTIIKNNNQLSFLGLTNENKKIYEHVRYSGIPKEAIYLDSIYQFSLNLAKDSTKTIYVFAEVSTNKTNENINNYNLLKKSHIEKFNKKWDMARVILNGKKKDQFLVDYSIYHLLILGNENYQHSIPARGVSGQVYKGAIFWDTEIFLLPFYTLTFKEIAKQLIMYRINTLKGAKKKAKSLGYDGAFYAWESQDSGLEACSKYNITDPISGKKIRTYFNEKQIHISFDIVYGILNYMNVSGDYSILDLGAKDIFKEVYKFAKSYATYYDDSYHFLDVIGPDEYHERIDDNAFTNYLAHYTILESSKYFSEEEALEMRDFANKIYLHKEDKNGLIEQFNSYYKLDDLKPNDVKKQLRCTNDYWGFVAKKTKTIKQADVITLLALYPNKFSLNTLKANYDFYERYTEHGSSLSASMYSLVASRIGYLDFAYKMFIKSASIDLSKKQKMYAGGIYIGGTHPASNAGAYLSLVFGFAGLSFKDNEIVLNPNLPKQIKELKFKIKYLNKNYLIHIFNKNHYEIMEVF